MRYLAPRPLLLALTLVVVVGAIAFIELRLDPTRAATEVAGGKSTASGANVEQVVRAGGSAPQPRDRRAPEEAAGSARSAGVEPSGQQDEAARIAAKEKEYERAKEIVAPSGFVNAEDVSITALRGEKVVLVEFWTYTCFNCQNVQPYVNAWHDAHADDGRPDRASRSPHARASSSRDTATSRRPPGATIEHTVVLETAAIDAYDKPLSAGDLRLMGDAATTTTKPASCRSTGIRRGRPCGLRRRRGEIRQLLAGKDRTWGLRRGRWLQPRQA